MDQQNRHNPPIWTEIDSAREITAALDSTDDERLWRGIRRYPIEEQALQLVADEAPRLAYRRQSTPVFSELLLVPVIETARDAVLGNSQTWADAEQCISDAVAGWVGRAGRHTIFRGVRPYDWIAAWEPSFLRRHLLAMVPGTASDKLVSKAFVEQLPENAPRLGFISLVLTREKGWPQLPEPSTVRDVHFRHVVGHALTPSRNCSPPEVLAPDQVASALADGLCLWLAILHDVLPIRSWGIAPCATRHDAVKVTLRLDDTKASAVHFTMRKHQIGQVGVDCVIHMLTSLAPMAGDDSIQ